MEGGRPSQEDAAVECVRCRQKLPCEAFDAERLEVWRRSTHITKYATCNACWTKPSEENAEVECVGCRKKLPCQSFDAERLSMWRRNRDIIKKTKCNACWAKLPDAMRNAQKQAWKQSLYKCSDCNSELRAHKFDTAKLRQLEETSTLYWPSAGTATQT